MTANPDDAVREALVEMDANEAMLALHTLAENAGVPRIAETLTQCRHVIAGLVAHNAKLEAQAEAHARDAARWNVLCNRIDTAGESEWATLQSILCDARALGAGALEMHLDAMQEPQP